MPSRPRASDVQEDEPDGAADGGVGAEARAEAPAAGVDAHGAPVLAVHDNEGRHGMSGRLHAVEVERGIEHRLHRRGDDREMGRLAAGHHGVDGELLEGGLTPERGHGPQRAIGRTAGEHGPDALGGGGHDGQSIAPAPLAEGGEEGVGIVLDFEKSLARREGRRGLDPAAHGTRPMRLASCSSACCARNAMDSGLSPPSGCWITRSGSPATPSERSSLTARP